MQMRTFVVGESLTLTDSTGLPVLTKSRSTALGSSGSIAEDKMTTAEILARHWLKAC
jgi:carbamoylphosphate synthase large subunit